MNYSFFGKGNEMMFHSIGTDVTLNQKSKPCSQNSPKRKISILDKS